MSRSLNEMRIREALRLRAMNLNCSQIAESLTVGCARSTLRELFKRCDRVGIDYEKSRDMTDSELESLIYPNKQGGKRPRTDLDESYWLGRLGESGKDRMTLWETEYLVDYPDGLSYGQFCHRLRTWEKAHNTDLSYPKDRKPGETMETDWCGEKPALVYDQECGEFIRAHFFVANLGFSDKIFSRAYPDEKTNSWIDGHTRAVEFYRGLPRKVTPDNTKTAVIKPHHYAPELNAVFAKWAEHYEVAIVPARVRKPKDKNRAEGAANLVTHKILPILKEEKFYSFTSLNQALSKEIEKLNAKPYQKRPGSRNEVFQTVDLPSMRPLPKKRFKLLETKWVRVSKNGYHVSFDKHLYSAPYQLAGEKLLLSASDTAVELLYDNKRVALHIRSYSRKHIYVTDPAHMPEKHKAQLREDCMNGDRYRKWANSIGQYTGDLIARLLASGPIEEQSYRSCIGILRFADTYSPEALEDACRSVLEFGNCGFKTVRALLEKGKQDRPTQTINEHENLRGSMYYARGGNQ